MNQQSVINTKKRKKKEKRKKKKKRATGGAIEKNICMKIYWRELLQIK